MLLINETNAERYLRDAGRITVGDAVEIARLSGGVSNEVLYVAFPREAARDFVLKQAREQLRVADPWFCGVDRIWREVEVLRICERVLAGEGKRASGSPPLLARTPRMVFEDRENYCFGMEAAPREHAVWKRQLLSCHSERSEESPATPRETLPFAQGDKAQDNAHIAEQCGRLLGTLHGGTWGDASVAAAVDDRRVFDELRLDPYYRTVARRHPDAAPLLNSLVDSVWLRRLCLVHADFSPKNLLVFPGGLMMVDFETGHYGDPAFDLGFFLSHLVLKAFYHAPQHEPLLQLTERFWAAYRETLSRLVLLPLGEPADPNAALDELERHAVLNLAGCAWARLDGKSPVEYLTDPVRRDQARALCRDVLENPPATWPELLCRLRQP
jgi:5-methylthioribose kinase